MKAVTTQMAADGTKVTEDLKRSDLDIVMSNDKELKSEFLNNDEDAEEGKESDK